MKRKPLFLAFILLIVFTTRSQDTIDNPSLTFPFWMARAIALDLEEKSRLEIELNITALELAGFHNLVAGLERTNSERSLQIDLLKENARILEQQLNTFRESRPGTPTFIWWLRLLGAVGFGYLVGAISR